MIIALLGALVFLFYQQKKMEAKHIPQSVQFDPEVEKQWQRLKNVDKDFHKVLFLIWGDDAGKA